MRWNIHTPNLPRIAQQGEVSFQVPIIFTAYIEKNLKFSEQDLHGAIHELVSGVALDGGTNIDFVHGTGKLLIVPRGGVDNVGTILVSGTKVDRNTGVEIFGFQEYINVDGAIPAVDTPGADLNGNVRHSISG